MHRRQFIGSALAFAGAGSFAGAASLSLGAAKVTSLSDGNLVLPGAFFFGDLPKAEVEEILQRHGVPTDELTPPCNVTLLQDGSRNVLFDVGAGSGFMPSAGTLLESLEGVGLTPEDITHVVFTHAHPDHLWGVLDDFDDPIFTQAEFLIGRKEWDYWTDPNTVDSIGEARASFAVGANRRLEAIGEQVTMIEPDQEVLPGVLAHASHGHTPGHLSFELRGDAGAVLIAGDAIGNGHVAFERPDWPTGADQDAEMGAASRVKLLDMLATDEIPVLGFHLPDGGLGRVERMGEHYRFIAQASQ